MPALSIAQQRLMGQAYAVKSGELDIKDVNPKYRDDIKKLADGMTLQQLKDYAETKHKGLPKKVGETVKFIPEFDEFVEETSMATVGSVNGMGAPAMPGNPGTQDSFSTQETGSGDIPFALSKGLPKKKKNSSFKSFSDFIKGSQELRSAY